MAIRTLHITNAFHATSGGIATFYRALLAAAEREGQELRLIVPGAEDGVEELGRYTRMYFVRAPKAPFNPNYRVIYPHHYLFPKSSIWRILCKEHPDLVEISDKYTLAYLGGMLRARMLPGYKDRPAVVGTSHERMDANMAAYFGASAIGQWFSRFYMKGIYFPMFDHHVANSAYTAEELRTASRGQDVERGVWIRPMGVDFGALSPDLRAREEVAKLAKRAGGNESSALLLYTGRLAKEKNLPLLAEAVEELVKRGRRDYRLLIVGDGSAREGLRLECEKRIPGRACFLGYVSDREELARLYANADAFVHPNPDEPFGIGPLEAMASGLAVVAPDRGGVLTYLNRENGWTAAPAAEAFADAVESVFADQTAAARKKALARETAKRFAWDRVAADYLSLYRALHLRTMGEAAAAPMEPDFVSTRSR